MSLWKLKVLVSSNMASLPCWQKSQELSFTSLMKFQTWQTCHVVKNSRVELHKIDEISNMADLPCCKKSKIEFQKTDEFYRKMLDYLLNEHKENVTQKCYTFSN